MIITLWRKCAPVIFTVSMQCMSVQFVLKAGSKSCDYEPRQRCSEALLVKKGCTFQFKLTVQVKLFCAILQSVLHKNIILDVLSRSCPKLMNKHRIQFVFWQLCQTPAEFFLRFCQGKSKVTLFLFCRSKNVFFYVAKL